MLSKIDILNEIGKGICIYPLNLNNIKENSLNLCAGEFAWATKTIKIYIDENEDNKNKRFSLTRCHYYDTEVTIKKGESAIIDEKYILLLPHSTTLIETKEVLSIGNYIGGTYHSKVGLVSRGIGHIGTMVGPNFSGESLIAFHNISDDLIVLNVGESFVSVVFHYLNTPNVAANPTVSGHADKFAELGLSVSSEQQVELTQDWKKQFSEVKKKMCESNEYAALKKDLKDKRISYIRSYINKKNIIISILAIILLVILYIIASSLDKANNSSVWVDRFFNVGFSGIFIYIFGFIFKFMKK